MDEATNLFYSDKLQATMNEHLSKMKKQLKSSSDPLQCIPNSTSLRLLQMFAEAHSIKGLCLEKKRFNSLNATASFKGGEDSNNEDETIIDSFEMASRMSIQHSLLMHQYVNSQSSSNSGSINQLSNGSNTAASNLDATNTANSAINTMSNVDDNLDLINPLYEIALQKAPLLYIKKGYL